ncbi:hypothetical protein ABZU32_34515 [Sphaerisporangium sp. NPDC005288]|uniref:hypothetical protein n=1 Tax=Sphaerisporangium sp. NPDC005288 TaxID=3155114 RepID=UPI0033B00ACA
MNRLFRVFMVSVFLITGVLVASGTANAAGSCSAIQGQYMTFKAGTPVHNQPSGSSSLWGTLGYQQPLWATGSCISSAGNQWWRVDVGTNGYIYDAYRVY